MDTMEAAKVSQEIAINKTYWMQRNIRFKDWYEILVMIDTLASKGLESYVSNEPQTFYDMAHYLLTRGELTHSVPVNSESDADLDRRAKIDRACSSNWRNIDRLRQAGGSPAFIDEVAFYLLTLGWYSVVYMYDTTSGELRAQVWNPYDVYPRFANDQLLSCVHSYELTDGEAKLKAEEKNWSYQQSFNSPYGKVRLDDFFKRVNGELYNIILIDGRPVTGWVHRPEMELMVAPVGGFPDKGSLSPGQIDWRKLVGRSIFEVNSHVTLAFNKWKTMVSQILRDTAQPITQEFAASPQATPEQIRERGALFHYSPGEQGLQRVPPAVIPMEIQAHLLEMRRELQKGGFNDAVWGMLEGQNTGYSISLMATSSANQILYPYMDAKHFIFSEGDRFWLSRTKKANRTFEVKGKFLEKLKPVEIPSGVEVIVESDVATPKDWLERSTIANQLKEHLDDATILTEILHQKDPQLIKRRKRMDAIMEHATTITLEMINGYELHAAYLESRGDVRQAQRFRAAANALEMQLGLPEPGQATPTEMTRVMKQREEGAPGERPTIASRVQPPEARGFTPQELRSSIGRGTIRRRE